MHEFRSSSLKHQSKKLFYCASFPSLFLSISSLIFLLFFIFIFDVVFISESIHTHWALGISMHWSLKISKHNSFLEVNKILTQHIYKIIVIFLRELFHIDKNIKMYPNNISTRNIYFFSTDIK